jgi:hypothetical protein
VEKQNADVPLRPARQALSAVRTFSTHSRPALRAAGGRPPARRRQNGHRGTGLTLHPRGNHTVEVQRRDGASGVWAGRQPSDRELPQPSRPLSKRRRRRFSRSQPGASARPRRAPLPRNPQPGWRAPWPPLPVGHPDPRAAGAPARRPARSRQPPPPLQRPAPAAPCSAPVRARPAGADRSCRDQSQPLRDGYPLRSTCYHFAGWGHRVHIPSERQGQQGYRAVGQHPSSAALFGQQPGPGTTPVLSRTEEPGMQTFQ